MGNDSMRKLVEIFLWEINYLLPSVLFRCHGDKKCCLQGRPKNDMIECRIP